MEFNLNITGLSTNRTQEMLRLTGEEDRDIGPLKLVHSMHGPVVAKMCRTIAQGTPYPHWLLFKTGLGVHPSGDIPVRLPAIVLPMLRVMERMQDAGLMLPKYLIYSAPSFIAKTNGFSEDRANETVERMMLYLQRYIERFHRRIQHAVRFSIVQQDNEEGIAAVHEDIREAVQRREKDVLASLHRLSLSEQKHSQAAAPKYSQYAAANAYYSGVGSTYPFSEYGDPDQYAVLPVGGIGEQPFFSITSHLAERRGKKIVPLIMSKVASRPAYYPYHSLGDPVSIDGYRSLQSAPMTDSHLGADLQALHADGATADALEDIYPARS